MTFDIQKAVSDIVKNKSLEDEEALRMRKINPEVVITKQHQIRSLMEMTAMTIIDSIKETIINNHFGAGLKEAYRADREKGILLLIQKAHEHILLEGRKAIRENLNWLDNEKIVMAELLMENYLIRVIVGLGKFEKDNTLEQGNTITLTEYPEMSRGDSKKDGLSGMDQKGSMDYQKYLDYLGITEEGLDRFNTNILLRAPVADLEWVKPITLHAIQDILFGNDETVEFFLNKDMMFYKALNWSESTQLDAYEHTSLAGIERGRPGWERRRGMPYGIGRSDKEDYPELYKETQALEYQMIQLRRDLAAREEQALKDKTLIGRVRIALLGEKKQPAIGNLGGHKSKITLGNFSGNGQDNTDDKKTPAISGSKLN